MKKSSKIILASVLAFSGAVFAFAGHHSCSSMNMQEKAERFNSRLGDKLELTEPQQAKLASLTSRMADIMKNLSEERKLRDQVLEELITEGPMDQAALLQRITQKTDRVNQTAPEVVSLIASFVDSLDAGQKADLKKMIKQRSSHGFGGHDNHSHWIDS